MKEKLLKLIEAVFGLKIDFLAGKFEFGWFWLVYSFVMVYPTLHDIMVRIFVGK